MTLRVERVDWLPDGKAAAYRQTGDEIEIFVLSHLISDDGADVFAEMGELALNKYWMPRTRLRLVAGEG